MKSAYLSAWDSGLFLARLKQFSDRFSPCRLCPRQCRAVRRAGETGYCGQGIFPRVARALPHFGEEPPLTGRRGAGTVFFSGCALRCVFCQNYQISQENRGEDLRIQDLAALFLDLQEKGCHNLDLVSPTPHLPFILQALAVAIPKGLRIPIVYNTHGYLLREVVDLLDGLVDIYLPDMKYGSEEAAMGLSAAQGYVRINRAAVRKMYRQVGPLQTGPDDIALRGLLVRHLILPAGASQTSRVLRTLGRISTQIPVSLMAQYRPCHQAEGLGSLNRPITETEYRSALESAKKLGFETLFIQQLASAEVFFPDFTQQDPFCRSASPVYP